MKKIAILSMQSIVNFGSVLQAYSLREILKELTCGKVEFLEVENEPALPSRYSVPATSDYETEAAYPSGILQRAKRWIIARLSACNKQMIRTFMENELGLTQENNKKTYDLVVVGSDEVFNHVKGIRLQLHGQVRQSNRVISYAASCGSALSEDIAPANLSLVRDAMGHFSALSVRDSATERYVSGLYDGPVWRHLDPVLVGNLYKRQNRPVPLNKYLLIYAYGQRIRTEAEIRAIRDFAKSRSLKIVAMGGSQFWCDLYIPASPFRLLDYFHHADYVITDTFHGTIFSVINHKRFAVILRKTNRSKLTSLLEDLGLEDRQVRDMEKLERVVLSEIDYDRVEQILERERDESRRYLREQLEVLE